MSDRNTLVLASSRWTQAYARSLQQRMEEGDSDYGYDNDPYANVKKYGSMLPVEIINREQFMCPGATRIKEQLKRPFTGLGLVYPASVTTAAVWQETVAWIRTWCRSDRDAFIRDTQLSKGEPGRVDVIEVDPIVLESAVNPMKDVPMGADELVDALAGRPKTMQNWFMTPFVERQRKFIVDAIAEEYLFDRDQPTLLRAKASFELDPVLQKASQFSDEDLVRLVLFGAAGGETTARVKVLGGVEGEELARLLGRKAANDNELRDRPGDRFLLERWRELRDQIAPLEQKEKEMSARRRKTAQEDLRFLEDVLGGRAFDAERLFKILNVSSGKIPDGLDPGFWHAEAYRTWKIHSDRKYEVKSTDQEYRNLSWPAQMQLRLMPERALVRYIKLYYPEGSGHVISSGSSNVIQFAQMLLPFHPVVKVARSKRIESGYGMTPQLSDLLASYGGKVKLFRDQ